MAVVVLRLGALVFLVSVGAAACSVAEPVQVARDEPAADSRVSIREFYQSWAGSAEDHQAARVLQAFAYNGEYAACVRQRGVVYDWEASIALVPELVDDGTWHNVWTFPVNAPLFSMRQIADAHNAAMELRMNNPKLTSSENEIGLACRQDVPTGDEDQIDAIANPSGLVELQAKWVAELNRVTRDLPSEDEYLSCVVGEGVPGSPDRPAKSLDDFQKYLMRLAPDFRVSAAPSQRDESSEWQAYLAAEQEFLAADDVCRSATVGEVLPRVVEASISFTEEHSQQIENLQEHWAAVRRDASAVGWGADSPLGKMTDELMNQPLSGIDEGN